MRQAGSREHQRRRQVHPPTFQTNGDNHDHPGSAQQATDPQGHGQRLDRLGARVLRLLHLRDRRVADLPADLLSQGRSEDRDHRVAGDVRRGVCRAAHRRLLPRPHGRHPRPQARAADLHVHHGLLHHRRGPAADVRTGRPAGAGAAGAAAPDPGLRGRRRDLGRQLDDPGACAVRTPRLLRELHAAGRAGRPDPGGRGVPAAGALHARARFQCMGLARAVHPELRRDRGGVHHPARGGGDARVRRRGQAAARCRGRRSSRRSSSTGPTCCA